MTALLTIVAAILVFGIVVLVHEWGHFRAARRCGVRVEEFAIGFGPAIWKHTGKDGTLYSIRLLPLGGYNMMAGYIDPDDLEEDESGRIRKSATWISTSPVGISLFLLERSRTTPLAASTNSARTPKASPRSKSPGARRSCPTPSTARPTRKPRRGSGFLSLPAAR